LTATATATAGAREESFVLCRKRGSGSLGSAHNGDGVKLGWTASWPRDRHDGLFRSGLRLVDAAIKAATRVIERMTAVGTAM